jgi:hypothetical protein
MKAYGGVDVYTHIFLSSAPVWGEWSASRPGRFTPGERAPSTHWVGGWVNLRTGLDDVENRKSLALPGLEPCDPSVVQPVASRYIDSQLQDSRYLNCLWLIIPSVIVIL